MPEAEATSTETSKTTTPKSTEMATPFPESEPATKDHGGVGLGVSLGGAQQRPKCVEAGGQPPTARPGK